MTEKIGEVKGSPGTRDVGSARQPITEEQGIHKTWWDEVQGVTLSTLPAFIEHLLNDYAHDYGTIVHAMAAGMRATFYAMENSYQGGITGFQAGALGWEIFREFLAFDGPAKLLAYDKLLYPQYADTFQQIDASTWEWVQKKAQEHLDTIDYAAPEVREHWQAIVAGVIPFGLRLEQKEPE